MAHTSFTVTTNVVMDQNAASSLAETLNGVVKEYLYFAVTADATVSNSFKIVPSKRTIEIKQDESPFDPLEGDDFFYMYCKHGRYSLGHKDAEDPYIEDPEDGGRMLRSDVLAILPLYLYDHSGITMNTTGFSCGWDSGCVGYIYCTQESLNVTGTSGTSEELCEYMKSFIDNTYDPYIRGDCWYFTVTDEEDDVVESCSGFVGDELVDTGILEHFHADEHDAVKTAWNNRFTH